MVTFLSGGTGTPKLLWGAGEVFDRNETTVIANTGDDVSIGGVLVCPDLDTVLYAGGDELDRERWWAIAGDTTATHEAIVNLSAAAGFEPGPRYLAEDEQTTGRRLERWRRFSGVGEFMLLGDRDRAVHTIRTGLLDEGYSLTELTARLARAFDLDYTLLPMSNDPVATILDTSAGEMHFQEFWVAHGGDPDVLAVEFRGASEATTTPDVDRALSDPVVIGPSNPVTSIGPLLALAGVEKALANTPVVAVSPFIEDQVFSGPAAKLMRAVGLEASTAGVAASYPFVDAFVLDNADATDLDRPVVRTETTMDTREDSVRVAHAVAEALEVVR